MCTSEMNPFKYVPPEHACELRKNPQKGNYLTDFLLLYDHCVMVKICITAVASYMCVEAAFGISNNNHNHFQYFMK